MVMSDEMAKYGVGDVVLSREIQVKQAKDGPGKQEVGIWEVKTPEKKRKMPL